MDVHAHELFNLIDAAPDGLTVDELRQQAASSLGPNCTFTTCSGISYTFEEVVEFFHQKQKVMVINDRMQLNKSANLFTRSLSR